MAEVIKNICKLKKMIARNAREPSPTAKKIW